MAESRYEELEMEIVEFDRVDVLEESECQFYNCPGNTKEEHF